MREYLNARAVRMPVTGGRRSTILFFRTSDSELMASVNKLGLWAHRVGAVSRSGRVSRGSWRRVSTATQFAVPAGIV